MPADIPMTTTMCAGCGSTFEQPNDPGRRALYCSPACKQRAYRARTHRTGHESRDSRKRQDRDRAWREQQRVHEEARRAREQARARGTSRPTTRQQRAAVTVENLLRRAASTTFPAEREACLAKVAQLRQKYDLRS